MGNFEQLMEAAVADGTILGAVLLAKDKYGKLDYYHAFGKRTVSPEQKPMDRDTIFMIASMTKLITTIAALQTVERGLITLDDDVAPLLPVLARQEILTGFAKNGAPVTKKREGPITLRQLLTHSFGGGYGFLNPEIQRYKDYHKLSTAQGTTVDDMFGYPLLHEPGEGWRYGSGLDWAGKLVEVLSGLSLEDYMKQNICGPLGLKDMTFWPGARPDFSDRQASMTIRDEKSGKAVQSRKPYIMSPGVKEACGGQGVFSSMPDYIEILHSLLKDDERLLRKETTEIMFKPQLSPAAKAVLVANLKHPEWAVGSFPDTEEYDWGLGGIVIDGDKHPNRKRGMLLWSGNANLNWFIDRTAGVCGVFGSQLLPPADIKIEALMKAFEEDVYSKMPNKTKL